jgi:hypothetical protein
LTSGRGIPWDGQFVEVFIEMMSREGSSLVKRVRPAQLADAALGRCPTS